MLLSPAHDPHYPYGQERDLTTLSVVHFSDHCEKWWDEPTCLPVSLRGHGAGSQSNVNVLVQKEGRVLGAVHMSRTVVC